MDKKDKIIIIFYVFLAISYTSAILYIDKSFSDIKFPEEIKVIIDEIAIVKNADVNKTKIFETMTDIQNYPIILPQNVVSVKILNQSSNVIYAEEELVEKFVKTKLIVRHTLVPYDKHMIEVMSGDAQGTVVTQTFEETNSTTIITTDVKLNLKGILAPFVYFPKQSVEQYADKTLDKIINYAIGFDDQFKKTIDDLYREILRRPADNQGLQYYGSLLESGKMTVDDIRNALLNSEERKSLLDPSEQKTIDELTDKTIQTIDDLYREILHRPADIQGLEYFGSLIESDKMTIDDIRNALLNSEERKSLLDPSEQKTVEELSVESKKTIDDLYREILRRPADNQGLQYYGSLLESGKMTVDDIKEDLFNSDEALSIRLDNPTKREIDDLYMQFFGKHADQQTLDYYFDLLQSKKITMDDVRNDLLTKKDR